MIRSYKTGRGIIAAVAAVMIVIYSVNCFLFAPLSTDLQSNVLYADGILPILVDVATVILESISVAFAYAALLTILYRFDGKGVGALFSVFGAVTAYKHAGAVVNAWIGNGSIPREWARYIADIVYFTALELLILWIAYLCVKRGIVNFTRHRGATLKAAEKSGEKLDLVEPYPFKCLYSRDNCLLRAAFVCAIVTLISELALTLANDAWLIIADGAPEHAATWIAMAVNYISKAILAIITYFVTLAVMNAFLGEAKKAES